jgi:hypothetical protein
VAIKVISKKKLVSAEEIADVQREVQIMHHLAGHSNVVCLKVGGYIEDPFCRIDCSWRLAGCADR